VAVKYPFQNLIFQGGGVKTFAYHGVLAVLEERGILPQIKRVGGTSAGALLAMLLSFRLSWPETLALFRTCDFSKIPEIKRAKNPTWTPRIVEREVGHVVGRVDAVNRLIKKYGWHASDYAYQWTQTVIAAQCHGNGNATFADFRAQGFRDLHVVATNISTRSAVVFSAETTPTVAVADAVRMSGSIPLFFEALQFDGQRFGAGDYFADGGVLRNYPLHIFDDPKYGAGNHWYFTGVNWATLGVRLYTPKDCPNATRPITNVLSYIERLFEALVEAQSVTLESSKVDLQRTISVCDCCVLATDFDLNADDENETYRKLVAAGREATTAYLAGYEFPLDPRLAIILRPRTVVERLKEVFGGD